MIPRLFLNYQLMSSMTNDYDKEFNLPAKKAIIKLQFA